MQQILSAFSAATSPSHAAPYTRLSRGIVLIDIVSKLGNLVMRRARSRLFDLATIIADEERWRSAFSRLIAPSIRIEEDCVCGVPYFWR
jgi:hypothetical protein